MSVDAPLARRWQLPARRKRLLGVAVPGTFLLVVLLMTLLGGEWDWRNVGIGVAVAGFVWYSGVALVKFADTPGPPGPRRLFPSQEVRRAMLRTVRGRQQLDDGRAAELRSLVEQTGSESARTTLTAPAMISALVGMGSAALPRWYGWLWFAMAIMFVALWLSARRDRRACAEFLDRY